MMKKIIEKINHEMWEKKNGFMDKLCLWGLGISILFIAYLFYQFLKLKGVI